MKGLIYLLSKIIQKDSQREVSSKLYLNQAQRSCSYQMFAIFLVVLGPNSH